jgi:hypothetical protein
MYGYENKLKGGWYGKIKYNNHEIKKGEEVK